MKIWLPTLAIIKSVSIQKILYISDVNIVDIDFILTLLT